MSVIMRLYYKLLYLLLNLIIKIKPIPEEIVLKLELNIHRLIVYILPSNSKADILILRSYSLAHNLPDPLEPLIINGVKMPRFISVYNRDKLCNSFTYFASKKNPISLFYSYLSLYHNNHNLDIQAILVSVMFGRSPKREKHISNILLPNSLKKILAIIWFSRDSFIFFSRFISLRHTVIKYGINKTIAQKLVRMARIYFIRQHLVVVGPNLPIRYNFFNKLTVSKIIDRAIDDEIHSKKISYRKVYQNTIIFMKEIAANFSYEIVRIVDRILSIGWSYLYHKINVSNIDRIIQLAYNGHRIIYIPCHRSHMDYLLLSYILYHKGLAPPHIAAGVNLNFWPIGSVFRCLGAFYIRRSFKNNKLYSSIFREYLSELINYGFSIEYFIEGRRSRTGRLLNPKTGILSITIQSILRNVSRQIILVPIYIGYEHIIEVNSYIKELHGTFKKKESLLQILYNFIKLHNLGQSHINFGEPLLLITWLNQHVPEWRKATNQIDNIRPCWLTTAINNIATDLMIRINDAGIVNATNLCYTALLASYKLSLTRKQLTEQLKCYLDLMRNVPYANNSIIPSISIDELINYVLQTNKFETKKSIDGEIIVLPYRQQIMAMSYYRNNIIHMLILPALVAIIIIKYNHLHKSELLLYIKTFYPMLKAELFLHWKINELNCEINKLINELIRQRLIFIEKDELFINSSRSEILQLLAANIHETLQRYAIVFWLLSKNRRINRNILEKESYRLARCLSSIHDIKSIEFFDKTIFSTLISTLRDEGYISTIGNVQLKKVTKVYHMIIKLIAPNIRLIIENIK